MTTTVTRAKKSVILWAMMVPWVVTIALVLGMFYRLDKAQERSDKDWCPVLNLIVTPNPRLPPRSAEQLKFVDEIKRLRSRKGCKTAALSLIGDPLGIQMMNQASGSHGF